MDEGTETQRSQVWLGSHTGFGQVSLFQDSLPVYGPMCMQACLCVLTHTLQTLISPLGTEAGNWNNEGGWVRGLSRRTHSGWIQATRL